jgi:hypothetical protein
MARPCRLRLDAVAQLAHDDTQMSGRKPQYAGSDGARLAGLPGEGAVQAARSAKAPIDGAKCLKKLVGGTGFEPVTPAV